MVVTPSIFLFSLLFFVAIYLDIYLTTDVPTPKSNSVNEVVIDNIRLYTPYSACPNLLIRNGVKSIVDKVCVNISTYENNTPVFLLTIQPPFTYFSKFIFSLFYKTFQLSTEQ